MTRRILSEEEVRTICLRYVRGDPIDEIAADAKTSPAHVRVVASRRGAKRPPSRDRRLSPPKPKEADIARRRAVLLGLEPRAPAPRRTIPDEDLLRYGGESLTEDAILAACDWDAMAACIERAPGLSDEM